MTCQPDHFAVLIIDRNNPADDVEAAEMLPRRAVLGGAGMQAQNWQSLMLHALFTSALRNAPA
jgi:hypothetical protein